MLTFLNTPFNSTRDGKSSILQVVERDIFLWIYDTKPFSKLFTHGVNFWNRWAVYQVGRGMSSRISQMWSWKVVVVCRLRCGSIEGAEHFVAGVFAIGEWRALVEFGWFLIWSGFLLASEHGRDAEFVANGRVFVSFSGSSQLRRFQDSVRQSPRKCVKNFPVHYCWTMAVGCRVDSADTHQSLEAIGGALLAVFYRRMKTVGGESNEYRWTNR